MIELSILELLYLVLIFFITIIGTLLIVILFKVLKVMKVATELADYYNSLKQTLIYYAMIPYAVKDKIFESIQDYTPGSSSGSSSKKHKKASD